MKSLLAALAGMLCAVYAQAQAPYLVTDLNTSFTPSAQSSNPKFFTASGASVYFSATTAATGNELFKTDGATVQLVKDLRSGTTSSTPASFIDLGNGNVVFSAFSDANGRELWRSDGTDAGTVLVKDIFPGTTSSSPTPLIALNGKVLLLATDSTGQGLWATDGQEAGTQQLVLVPPGPFRYATLGNILYFSSGEALWRTDGTPAGTSIVKSGINARSIIATTDKLFLAAWDQLHGYELWKSDGTEAGTTIVKDINPGAAGAFYTNSTITMATIGSAVLFFAVDGEHGLSLWRSDGTEAGTLLYNEFALPSTTVAPALYSSAGVAFFVLQSSLWRTDGTVGGTFSLAQVIGAYAFVPTPTTLYFLGATDSTGYRLWKSDGSDVGTTAIAPNVSVAESDPQLRYTGGKLYFAGTTGLMGIEPWTSNLTAAGTVMLANLMADPPASANPLELRAAGGKIYFLANDGTSPAQLYRSDGTGPTTIRLTNFADTGTSAIDFPTPWNDQLFFLHSGKELWHTDGTVVGTTIVKSMSLSSTFSASNYFYFTGYLGSPTYAYQLWRTDGTVAGTIPVTTMPSRMTPVGDIAGRFYFLQSDVLWRTDGTSATTESIGNLGYYTLNPVIMGGAIYYSSAGTYPNYELWKTDGTPEGASLVKEIRAGSAGSNPRNMTPAGSLLFFTADNGTTGEELWRSDGTEDGTFLLKDILPGIGSSIPSSMVTINGVLYFVANNGVDGAELWKSDGTVAGTVLVADLAPGASSSAPSDLAGADGKLWFAAATTAAGTELWTSDGTAGGTTLVSDIEPGTTSSAPRVMTAAGRRLYFSAETSAGRELWALPLASTAFSISDARIVEQDSGTQQLRFTVTRTGTLTPAATVAFSTASGTATAGADFVALSGTASFAIGATTAFIDVQVMGDNIIERNESFFVNLSAPSTGVIERNVGIGTIDDDDRSSALSVTLLQEPSYGNGNRRIIVTNAGPSSATSVQLIYIESPFSPTLYSYYDNCVSTSNSGSVVCSLGTILPGENRTITLQRSYQYGTYYDVDNPPGVTSTATVSATEADPDPSDNTVARMFSLTGGLMTPPFLVTNTTATAEYSRVYYGGSSATTVTLASTNPVVVPSPATLPLAVGQLGTTFSLQVGNAPGKTMLSTPNGGDNEMVIPIVAPGVTAKLDVALTNDMGSYYKYGQNVVLSISIIARTVNGTLPTGMVELLDDTDVVIAQAVLNGSATASFTRTGLTPGQYFYTARYLGDSNFNPLTVDLESFTVSPWSTSTTVTTPRVICGNTVDVLVTVSTNDTTTAPPGQVTLYLGNQTYTLDLIPSAEPGKSTATTQLSLPQSYSYISAQYAKNTTFGASSSYDYLAAAGGCTTIGLSATATATNRVALSWTSTGASSYEILRADYYNGFSTIGYAAVNSYLDTQAQPNRTYLYRVRPANGLLSEPDVATTFFFTDDPIVVKGTRVKALHFTQLRTVSNYARTTARLAETQGTGITPVINGAILPSQIMALRATIDEARRYLGLLPLTYTNPTLTSGTPIKAVHMQELRNALK